MRLFDCPLDMLLEPSLRPTLSESPYIMEHLAEYHRDGSALPAPTTCFNGSKFQLLGGYTFLEAARFLNRHRIRVVLVSPESHPQLETLVKEGVIEELDWATEVERGSEPGIAESSFLLYFSIPLTDRERSALVDQFTPLFEDFGHLDCVIAGENKEAVLLKGLAPVGDHRWNQRFIAEIAALSQQSSLTARGESRRFAADLVESRHQPR